jgi:hypothetical protein
MDSHSRKELAREKETVLPIDLYSCQFFETVNKQYEEMIRVYNEKKESVDKKHNYFRVES